MREKDIPPELSLRQPWGIIAITSILSGEMLLRMHLLRLFNRMFDGPEANIPFIVSLQTKSCSAESR